MKTIDTRFGEVEYDPSHIIEFPEGLIGLDQLKHFLVMPNKKEGPLFWIQCVDDPAFAFVVTDPTNFFLGYKVIPDSSEMKILGITSTDDSIALSIVTVSKDKEITLNLAAPILFSSKTNRAIQVILEDSSYSSQTRLPDAPPSK